MIKQIKSLLYFPLSYYFRFFAKIQLSKWKPRIIVVTGSSGKTTLLHLIESQIQDRARYSHQANSSYGIPFDILRLRRKSLTPEEWIYLILAAPFKAFKKPPREKLYIVEADCDRPYEGIFLASLLKPNVTLWTNVSRTHSMNFDNLVKNQNFKTVEGAIAHEFGYFLETTSDLAILNSDNELIKKESRRSKATIKYVSQKDLNNYKVFKDHTEFKINAKDYSIKALLPKETSYSIAMVNILLDFLNEQLIIRRHSGPLRQGFSEASLSRISLHHEENERDSGVANAPQNDDWVSNPKIEPDPSFSKFKLPPGRTSVFNGIKNTTIIDSTYNATPDGMKAILQMFDLYPANIKWVVLGDMIELGAEEQEEHEKLADMINSMKLDKIILVGPRLSKYTYPKLKEQGLSIYSSSDQASPESREVLSENSSRQARTIINLVAEKFIMPKDALDYLLTNLRGDEAILFKGARFLEGIIEHLLLDKNDVKKLARREKIWQIRRRQWGL